MPPLEKLRLAELLLADLDTPDPEIDTIWRDEAQKRWQAYRDGELKMQSYEAVMKKYKLIQKKHQELADLSFYLDCKEAKDENEFLSEQEQKAFIDSL